MCIKTGLLPTDGHSYPQGYTQARAGEQAFGVQVFGVQVFGRYRCSTNRCSGYECSIAFPVGGSPATFWEFCAQGGSPTLNFVFPFTSDRFIQTVWWGEVLSPRGSLDACLSASWCLGVWFKALLRITVVERVLFSSPVVVSPYRES